MRSLGDRAKTNAESGVSILLEYVILAGILSLFVVVLSLQLNDALEKVQVERTIQNQFSDVASQVSALYTDYVLMRPEQGKISTVFSMLPKIGEYTYSVQLNKKGDLAYLMVKTPDGKYTATSSLGFSKFIFRGGELRDVEISQSNKTESMEMESETGEKPELTYESEKNCSFIPQPRISISPSSVALTGSETKTVTVEVFFLNEGEITSDVVWLLEYWSTPSVVGHNFPQYVNLQINWSTVTSSSNCFVNGNNATCWITIKAWKADDVECNSTYRTSVLVSRNPEQTPPQLIYEKWVEPSSVDINEPFDIHLRLEGRGFVLEGAQNLTTVHVVDISGSMTHTTLFEDLTTAVVPKIVEMNVNVTGSGTFLVRAYTNDTLPGWYPDELCKACPGYENSCLWYGEGYSDDFLLLEVNGDSASPTDIPNSNIYGKYYTESVSSGKNFTIRIVARAPDPIDLHIEAYLDGTLLNNCTLTNPNQFSVSQTGCNIVIHNYTNYQLVKFDLPNLAGYTYLMIDDVDDIPYWGWRYWSDWQTIEYYWGDCQYLWWDYRYVECGSSSFYDNPLHVWVIDPANQRDFLYKYGSGYSWYQAETYYGGRYYLDLFRPYPSAGTYYLKLVNLDFSTKTFKGKVYIKRMDAAKVAAKTFNNMLGDKDFVGLVKFSTDASRISVNISPLEYLTTNKGRVNNEIDNFRPTCATDPAEGLYRALKTFPIWGESDNNCTECINKTRPLVILLTDGRPTSCNDNYPDVNCPCNRDPKQQAVCMANVLKSTQVNGFNISLCTIGFGPDIDEDAQDFLRSIASIRPDNDQPCYFFAQTSEDLVNAFREIFNIYRIAAKNIIVSDTVNTSFITSFQVLGVRAYECPYNYTSYSQCDDISSEVVQQPSPNGTVIRLQLPSIQIDQVVEIIITAKIQEEGEFKINHEDSWIEYDAVDVRGEVSQHEVVRIISDRDVVKVGSTGGAEVGFG